MFGGTTKQRARQQWVLRLLASGLTQKQVAELIEVPGHVVTDLLEGIRKRAGGITTIGVVVKAVREGII